MAKDAKGALVEVSWNQRAPNDVEALDDANMHVVRRFMVRGDSIEAVPPSAHVEPTGDSIQVPVEGVIPVGLAYRVRLPGDSKTYWTIPAAACRVDVDLGDGSIGRGIGTCSAIGDEEPTLFDD